LMVPRAVPTAAPTRAPGGPAHSSPRFTNKLKQFLDIKKMNQKSKKNF
jgi:hypothetical protein